MGHVKDGEKEEIEAHFFAAQLFMPEYSILMMKNEHGKVSYKDLIEIFGVSEEDALKRIKTMNRKSMFRASSIDKEIWAIQRRRVELYYECKKDRYEYRNTLDFMLYMESEFERELLAETYASAY